MIKVLRQCMKYRKLSSNEENLLDLLICRASLSNLRSDWKANLVVHPMEDGGMGSLRLFPNGPDNKNRMFGSRVSEYQFQDVDGVLVVASLNLDDKGALFELDIWKTDFSPLVQIPEISDPNKE